MLWSSVGSTTATAFWLERRLRHLPAAAARCTQRRGETDSSQFDSISSTIRDVLHWLPIRQRVDFKLSVLMFNCLRNLAPGYLMNVCQPVTSNLHRRRLRSAVRAAWRPHRSTDEDSPLRSTQLCCHWAVNVECAIPAPLYATTKSLPSHFVAS